MDRWKIIYDSKVIYVSDVKINSTIQTLNEYILTEGILTINDDIACIDPPKSYVDIKRHALKAISYRFLGTLQTMIISFIFTGSITISSGIGIVEFIIKPINYFIHERIWYKWIRFGRH